MRRAHALRTPRKQGPHLILTTREAHSARAIYNYSGESEVGQSLQLAAARNRMVGNRPALLGAVGKDLAHTPDHELGRWLERIDLTAPA